MGETHNATHRLEVAHLVQPHQRAVNKEGLLEFLLFGVPYVFPGDLGPEIQGVPTAHSGPALSDRLPSIQVIVWPSHKGEARGASLEPLCASAPLLIT